VRLVGVWTGFLDDMDFVYDSLRWNKLCFEGIFKSLPCSIIDRLGCNGHGHFIASPFASWGVSFKVGQS